MIVALLFASRAAWAVEFDPALVDAARREAAVTWYTGLIVNQADSQGSYKTFCGSWGRKKAMLTCVNSRSRSL